MKYLLSVATLALLITSHVEARWVPNQHETWNIALGSGFDISRESADVLEVDLENTSSSKIQDFHKRGKKVICYFSGGTVEDYRSYFNQYTKVDGLVRNKYSAWPRERWLDYRVSGYKSLIKQRISEAVSKHCDGIDVDNVDGYQVGDVKNNWSDPLTKQDAIKFTSWLGQTAHDMGIAIGLKNCLDIVDTVGKYYDFAVNEGCARRNECHWYKNFLSTGKPVLGITYHGLSSNRDALCKNLNGLPISMIIKDGEELVQKSIIFDGKKHCGSSFQSGKVGSPSRNDEPKKTTTVKKTTTIKKTTTVAPVAAKKITTINRSTKVTPTGIPKPFEVKPANTPVVSKPVVTSSNPTGSKPVVVPINPVESKPTANPINPTGSNPVVTPGNPTGSKPAVNPSNPAESKPVIKEGNNTSIVSPTLDKANPDDDNSSTVTTGVAITGSVLGAAAVFAFLKKNPKKFEGIKRGLSRSATSIKRGASTISRRVTTKGRN
ncbi:hypothetical protein BCR36DRAFT_344570 [Piromyces finnis]|uniref:alpha-galactosidase n=1 Tax=Piromyces finnis TaxID=1754191 RepID=A0A1Y1VJE2_9FUNG|nr:hypothetical protein BCR36DRAFT_344570 [Piromyces finnis]|eukprot:ORX57832.1 hypothetical protein BCR36DRAFT_344570 [Piromyces finnis]